MIDHGILNVPLAKRGNIDAQIDRYKREQAGEQKQARRVTREQGKAAHASLLEVCDGHAERLGISKVEMRKQLARWARYDSARLIALHTEWSQR